MQDVVTIIAAPARADLGPEGVAAVAQALRAAGAKIVEEDWLDEGIACDVVFRGLERAAARRILETAFADAPFDLVVLPRQGRRKDLLVADMDATIVACETLDELAERAGLRERIAAITACAMRGEREFKAALRERVAMLEGLPIEAMDETLRTLRLTSGARKLVQTMRAHGAFTLLVSGGFRYFTSRIAEAVGFDAHVANRLEIVDRRLTGRVVEPVLDDDAKLAAMKRHARDRNVPLSETLAIGDGANDLPMIKAAGLGVAFRAKPVVVAEAPATIRHGDLTALLYLQGYRGREFRT